MIWIITGDVFNNVNEVVVEIHFGEGGEDSKLFVKDLFAAYCKWGVIKNLKCEILDEAQGHILAKFWGPDASEAFKYETGKHAIQRVPPTERSGRVHTSMVSVAVLPIKEGIPDVLEKDLEITTQKGHGPGGQHQNKTESAVRIRHLPTGLMVFINGRDQHSNRREALKIISARVAEHYQEKQDLNYNSQRKTQLDGGGRSNKIRTYNFKDSRAVDHRLGTKTGNVRAVIEKGRFDLLIEGGKKR